MPPESSGGGAEKHGYYLANHIAKLGHEVFFVSKTRAGAEYESLVTVCRVPPKRGVIPPKTPFFGWVMKHLFGNILSSLVAFRILLKESFHFDVIHCHGALTALFLSIFLGRRVPVVYTMHDASPWIAHYPGIHRRAFRKLAYLMIDVPCLRSVRQVIAVSPTLRDEARRLGTSPSRVTFIPNGITIPSLRNSPRETGYGLFVGQLVPRKRVDLLVKAASELADQNIRFVVVGDGPERLRLAQLSERLGVSDRISFTGYVDDAALANYYSGALFFVFPSSAEGFPIVVLEAMSYGLPVIATGATVYSSILLHGASLVFKSGDMNELKKAIENISSDHKLREKLSSSATSAARKHFSWEAVAKRVLSVYEQVLPQGRPLPQATIVPAPHPQQVALTAITREIASRVPTLAIYLVGSMARGFGEHARDYDVIAMLKTQLVPIYLRRLKTIGTKLTNEFGLKVEVNPLPTLRLSRAKGSLFLVKAKEEAKLLYGKDVLREADTGGYRDVSADWYFSFFSSLLKDLLDGYEARDTKVLNGIAQKIVNSLSWLSRHSREDISRLVSVYASDFSTLASSNEVTWFDVRERMITLFKELVRDLLHADSTDLPIQTEVLMRKSKGKNITKNFEYGILLLMMRREIVSPKRVFSRILIQDRYRAGLILLSAAASKDGYDADLTFRAYSILKSCLKMAAFSHPAELWRSLRKAILEYWSLAQPVMGL